MVHSVGKNIVSKMVNRFVIGAVKAYDMVQSFGSTETCRSHANDEDIYITGKANVSSLA